MSRFMRSAGGLGGCVEGLLLGDGGVFFLGRGGPGGGIVGVTVDGELLEAGPFSRDNGRRTCPAIFNFQPTRPGKRLSAQKLVYRGFTLLG